MSWVLRLLAGVLLLGPASCGGEAESEPSATEALARPSAEVGVFYGGQVQHKKHVVVNATLRPKIGFKILFPPPPDGEGHKLDQAQPVHFEITRMGPEGRRVTERGKLVLAAGQQELSHLLTYPDPIVYGVWNVRVTYLGNVLADRALFLSAAQK